MKTKWDVKTVETPTAAAKIPEVADKPSESTATENKVENVEGNIENVETHPDLTKILKLATCSICLSTLSTPTTTQCSHTFCLTCIHAWLTTSQQLSCPSCRTQLTQPPTTCLLLNAICEMFGSTSNDSLLGAVQELFKGQQRVNDEEDGVQRCGICNWECVDGICVQCDGNEWMHASSIDSNDERDESIFGYFEPAYMSDSDDHHLEEEHYHGDIQQLGDFIDGHVSDENHHSFSDSDSEEFISPRRKRARHIVFSDDEERDPDEVGWGQPNHPTVASDDELSNQEVVLDVDRWDEVDSEDERFIVDDEVLEERFIDDEAYEVDDFDDEESDY